MSESGAEFLHERNTKLHSSKEVETVVDYLRKSGDKIPNKPSEKIGAYLGFLADKDLVNDGMLTGDKASIARQVDHFVIKAEDVPEAYFDLQARIMHEQGHGAIEEIKARITPDMRRQMIEATQADQRGGVTKWANYLTSEDGGYPDWFKYYAIESVTKLGNFDKEKGEFLKRSKGTTAPYPDLNREALAYVYDALNKAKVLGEKVEGGANDDKLQKLLQGANFGKLYAHAVLEVTPASKELRKQTEGSWTKYDQTTDPEVAKKLAGSLQGHGTGWCTAGESTASSQLQDGDFYVYYTRDEAGKDTIPRVAIRMQGGAVAEVRGIEASQELEPELADITSDRLRDLPGGEVYVKNAEDMKRLTGIDNKRKQGEPLVVQDLIFLYEIDNKIEGFGYQKDPRIAEIRQVRNAVEDMSTIFDLQPDQIARSAQEIDENTRAYIGKLEPGIFSALQKPGIEHIYASFPEGRIKRDRITIGGKTSSELLEEFRQGGINVGIDAKRMMENPDFTTQKNPKDIDLVSLRVGDLGLTGIPMTEQVYKRARQLGLHLCPAEVGPHMRLNYAEQPWDEYLHIGMEPIFDSNGYPRVFDLGLGFEGQWLNGPWMYPEDQWEDPDYKFVFRLSPPASETGK